MQKKQLELLLALGLLFVLTGTTSFLLCEKDIVLDYINRIGHWSTAGLYHAAFIFGIYKFADYAYNLDYVLPKLINSFAPVKWADKLNGYLGFNSKGELEQYLASHNYNPLYKDALNGIYFNIGVPLYNEVYAPMLGLKPKKEINKTPVPEPLVFEIVKEKTIYINKVHVVEKHDEDVLALRDEINKARVSLDKLVISKSLNIDDAQIVEEIRLLSQFEEAITYTTTQLQKSFTSYSMLLADEDRGAEIHPHKIKYLEFHRNNKFVKLYFDHPSQLFVDIPLNKFKQDFPIISRVVNDIITPVHSYKEEVGSDGVWRMKPLSDWVYVAVNYDTFRHSWLRTDFHINPENCLLKVLGGPISYSNFDLPEMSGRIHQSGPLIEKIREHLMSTLEREQTAFDGHLTSIETTFSDYLNRTNPQDDVSINEEQTSSEVEPAVIDGSIAGETINWLPAASVGILTTLTVSQALVVFSYFFGIEAFQVMIQNNIHVQEALMNLYNSNNMEMPTILSDAINNSPASSTNSFTFDSTASTSGFSFSPDNSIIKYVGYSVLAVGVIGITWYLTKYGMDPNPVAETAKTFKETLQDKYTNFK